MATPYWLVVRFVRTGMAFWTSLANHAESLPSQVHGVDDDVDVLDLLADEEVADRTADDVDVLCRPEVAGHRGEELHQGDASPVGVVGTAVHLRPWGKYTCWKRAATLWTIGSS
jgi:hypothetical protein